MRCSCNAAAAGDLSASRGLMVLVKDLEAAGHTDSSTRILEAIPYKHFSQIYDENEIIPQEQLVRMARNLIPSDPDKAIAIYGKVLSTASTEGLPEGLNAQNMATRAAQLAKDDDGALAVAVDIYEFMALAQPESNAVEHLADLTLEGKYPTGEDGNSAASGSETALLLR